jgi:predicted component of type VI protein secretion system
MEAKLVVVGGRVNKNVIPLSIPSVLGRGRDAKLTIAHPLISRRHCQLTEKDGLLMLEDLGSLNGTFIDGNRIKTAPLPPDAEFTVGPLTFRAQYDYSGDLSKLPPPVLDDTPGAARLPQENEKNVAIDLQATQDIPSPDFHARTTAPLTALPPAPTGGALDEDFSLLGEVGSSVSPMLSSLDLEDSKKPKPNNK